MRKTEFKDDILQVGVPDNGGQHAPPNAGMDVVANGDAAHESQARKPQAFQPQAFQVHADSALDGGNVDVADAGDFQQAFRRGVRYRRLLLLLLRCLRRVQLLLLLHHRNNNHLNLFLPAVPNLLRTSGFRATIIQWAKSLKDRDIITPIVIPIIQLGYQCTTQPFGMNQAQRARWMPAINVTRHASISSNREVRTIRISRK